MAITLIISFPAVSFSGKWKTPRAPEEYLGLKNPLELTPEALKEAKAIYKKKCKKCHGSKGNGRGSATRGMKIKPRNYTDKALMEKIPDGQLFWIVLNGSDPEATEMEGYKRKFSKEQVWKLIHYIRSFSL